MHDPLLIPLSALQHYVFCPRQCAIIHNEQYWQNNYHTTLGNQLHERVDSGISETRNNIRYERGVMVNSTKYLLTGKLDLLEYDKIAKTFTPVEYKKGKQKNDYSDLVQLCAQALCIEDMCNTIVTTGAMWYWQTRKRIDVAIDNALRQKTIETIDSVRTLLNSTVTPLHEYSKKCESCSLIDICTPKLLNDRSINYIKSIYNGEV